MRFNLTSLLTTVDAMEVFASVSLDMVINLMFGVRLLHCVIVSGIRIDKKVIILHFSEEGYDSGHSPEPLVNVTAVPLVSEILQVFTQFCEASHICHSCS